MKDHEFLAHIADDGRQETVKEHLIRTAELSSKYAESFGAAEQGYLCGISHDIGKYSLAFQKRLKGAAIHVDHSTAGAVECIKINQPFAAISVAGHHGGLPDGGSKIDNSDSPSLWGRLNRANQGKIENYESWGNDITLPKAKIPDFLMKSGLPQNEAVFFTRMLYSCLVDADFISTEEFMSGQQRYTTESDIGILEEKLEKYISAWFPPKGELNETRCSILESCREAGTNTPQGLYTLTVPTGGGKTVSSLAFALSHAKKNNLKRIIYVIPYTSIIEQNAQVFREILGDEVVLEHHSSMLYDLEGEATAETIRMAKATENWDMPVIVTTAVQFFESLFSCKSSKCRKLHNLAESVIIFDEAQMLPIPYLRPCIYAISQLVSHYRSTAVLCTATQPALEELFKEYLPDIRPKEICPQKYRESGIFKRVRFNKKGKMTWDDLADELNNTRQVLCIVNSRKGAQEVFKKLDQEGSFHLSTMMYPKHREKVLEEIRERLKNNLECRVVSTSLIEAGVDVDFPVVYREEAGLDSILQAAGRCNREGKRLLDESVVNIFESELKSPPIFSMPIGAGKSVMGKYEDISSSEAMKTYFNELFNLKGKDALDKHNIMQMMERELLPFRKIADNFHLIESNTRTIYIPLDEGEILVEKLRKKEYSKSLFRKLGKYSVSAYNNQFVTLENAGALELLEDGSAILLDLSLYNPSYGLAPEADSGNALFI